jgi:Flp pilus assembly protein TadG
MQKKLLSRQRPHERGQTMVLVAISLVSLLAMAALAIDIVTLYAARSEVQRAADAAALAGAKAIADSGITTLLVTDPNFTTVQPWAVNAAKAQINAVMQNNVVAGVAPSLASGSPSFSWSQGNPQVTVKLSSSNLPTFFSKIWGGTTPVATATATAEVYNPANLPNFVPIVPKAVKPWLVANADPTTFTGTNPAPNFINPSTGAIEPGVTVVGEQFYLHSDCQIPAVTPCALVDNPPGIPSSWNAGHQQVDYAPAAVTTPPSPNPNVCPPSATGGTDYEQSIACADVSTSYQVVTCGGGTANAQWDNAVNPGGLGGSSDVATEWLIHATAPGYGNGQDSLTNSGPWPTSPMQITAGSGSAQNGNPVTTSNSIVTIPIVDTSATLPATGGNVTIDGYIQAFINEVHGVGNVNHQGDIQITVLNIVGCGSSSTNLVVTPIVGGSGTSPVPVRLIGP